MLAGGAPQLHRDRSSYRKDPSGLHCTQDLNVPLNLAVHLFLCNIFNNKLVNLNKCFWVLWVITTNYQTCGKGHGNVDLYPVRQKYENPSLAISEKVGVEGQSCFFWAYNIIFLTMNIIFLSFSGAWTQAARTQSQISLMNNTQICCWLVIKSMSNKSYNTQICCWLVIKSPKPLSKEIAGVEHSNLCVIIDFQDHFFFLTKFVCNVT